MSPTLHLAFSFPSSRTCSGTAHTLVSRFTGRRPARACLRQGVLASMAREVSVPRDGVGGGAPV